MDNELDKNARAAEWLKMTEGKWRLQTLQHRGRYNVKTGEYKNLPTRLRRFLNGTPVSVIGRTLEMLKAAAPYRSPVYNWEYDEGLEYRPTTTLIRKDGPETTTNGKDSTYTIIQDLRLTDEDGETFDVDEGSSCSNVSKSTYHWDETDVESCPTGGQGVSYRIQNVNRDHETDLFSYTVVKTVAITQHMPEHTVQCSDRRKVTVETYDNVYGSEGSYRYDGEVNAGEPIVLPQACEQPGGTSVEVSVQENSDCTFKVQIQRTYAYTDGRAFSIYKDQYKIQSSESVVNSPIPLPRTGVEYSGGVTTKYSSEKNEDGTWNNTTDVETERPVPSSTVEMRVTPRYSTVTTVDTNQPAPVTGIPGGGYGSFKSTKTNGGLFTNEYTTFARNVIDQLGKACEDTAFLHSHEKAGTAAEFDEGHVPPAANGLVTSWNFSTDESTGAINRTVRTRQEHTVERATVSRSKTLYGTSSSYGSRSVPLSTANGLIAAVSRPGDTATIRMTDGRMWDVEVSSFTKAYGAKLSLECGKTFFRHDHTLATTVQEIGAEATDAGDGYTYRRSYSTDPQHGTVTMHESYSKELNRPSSGGTTRITSRAVTTSVTNTQVPSRTKVTGVGQAVEWRRTDGGLYTETVTSTEARPGRISEECSKTQFQHQHGSTTVSKDRTLDSGHVQEASGGLMVQKSERLDDDGLWTLTEGTTRELPVMQSTIEKRMTPRGLVTTIVNTQIPGRTMEFPQNKWEDVGMSLQVTKTPGKLVNETFTSLTPYTSSRSEDCTDDLFKHQHTSTSTNPGKTITGEWMNQGHVKPPEEGSGRVLRYSETLTEGGWDFTESFTQEHEVEVDGAREYRDAFGATAVHEMTNTNDRDLDGGVSAANLGTPAALLRSMERSRTPGNRYVVKATEETPLEQHTPWFESTRKWYNDGSEFTARLRFMEFRNATRDQVDAWIKEADNYDIGRWPGCFVTVSVNPSVSINKFKLFDGRISMSVNASPRGFAGGSSKTDNWERTITYEYVTFTPTRDTKPAADTSSGFTGKMLKTVKRTTRRIGGGVGRSEFENIIPNNSTYLEGSTFSYDPAGQRFTYNLIVELEVTPSFVDAGSVNPYTWRPGSN